MFRFRFRFQGTADMAGPAARTPQSRTIGAALRNHQLLHCENALRQIRLLVGQEHGRTIALAVC
jgi:hypothetical protein